MNRFSRRLLLLAKLSQIGLSPQTLLVYRFLKIYTNKKGKLTFLATGNDDWHSLQVQEKCQLKEPEKDRIFGKCA